VGGTVDAARSVYVACVSPCGQQNRSRDLIAAACPPLVACSSLADCRVAAGRPLSVPPRPAKLVIGRAAGRLSLVAYYLPSVRPSVQMPVLGRPAAEVNGVAVFSQC